MKTKNRRVLEDVARELEDYSAVLGRDTVTYWEGQNARFRFLATVIGDIVEDNAHSSQPVERILDIGNSFQTLMVNKLWPDIQIDTFGFFDKRYTPSGKTKHFDFDLNDAHYPEKRFTLEPDEKYDLILFLEVIEHLYTAPETVLDFLASLLKPGGRIIVQTPNAVALVKRVIMLLGRNPFELIRTTRENPGHFREYTKAELVLFAEQAGLAVESVSVKDYFKAVNAADVISQAAARLLPDTFKSGITLVLRVRD